MNSEQYRDWHHDYDQSPNGQLTFKMVLKGMGIIIIIGLLAYGLTLIK